MKKHTPGPWRYVTLPTGEIRITGHSQYIVDPCKMEEANARLIVTAPDLLEAAKLVIARWEKGDLAAAVKFLHVAVDKAEGKYQ